MPTTQEKNQGGEALKKAVRGAEWLGAGAPSTPAPLSSNKIAAKLVANADESGSELKEKEVVNMPSYELVSVGDMHELTLGDPPTSRGLQRVYRVGGLLRNSGLESMKVTLRLRAGEAMLLKRDLGKLLLACEQAQDTKLKELTNPTEEVVELSPEETKEAETLLKSPNLIEKLDASFSEAGIVGESTNRLAAYLTATSRLLAKPLAVIIQSTSKPCLPSSQRKNRSSIPP